MSPKNGSSPDDRSASIWVFTLNRDSNDPERIARFGLWLAESRERKAQFIAACENADIRLTRPMRKLLRMVRRLEYSSALDFSVRAHAYQPPRWPMVMAVGSAVLALLVAAPVYLLFARQLDTERYATAVGGYEQDVFRDGTVAELNTATTLSASIGKSKREISLSRGEALFKVAHDPARPFIVHAGNTFVRAVGTVFTVRVRSPEHVEVLVSEGQVAVTHEPAANGLLGFAGRQRLVSAGEVADDDALRTTVRSVTKDEIATRQAWREGRIVLGGKTLSEIVEEFNRYNSAIQLVVADPKAAGTSVGGQFNTHDVDAFLAGWVGQNGNRVERVQSAGDETEVVRLYGPDDPR